MERKGYVVVFRLDYSDRILRFNRACIVTSVLYKLLQRTVVHIIKVTVK